MLKNDHTDIFPSSNRFPRRVPEVGGYLATSLNEFYTSAAHRLLLYTLTFILSGIAAFVAVWIYDTSFGIPLYNDIPLSFKGMYAWHTAANFAVCFLAVDSMATALFKLRKGRESRTVGKTWLVFLIAFLTGFALQRTLVYQWVDLYAPKLILRHETYPAERPGAIPMFFFMLPFCLVIGFFLIRFTLQVQARSEELLRVRVDTILEERAHVVKDLSPASHGIPVADDALPLPLDKNVAPIRPSQIGHVSAEDHYLRIHYRIGDLARETLIRMSLKGLTTRLPDDRFFRIHRSHLVNLQWVAGVKRVGREVRLILKHGTGELPVSRYRLPQLLPVLDKYLERPDVT